MDQKKIRVDFSTIPEGLGSQAATSEDLRGPVGRSRSLFISQHTPSPTPTNHTLCIDAGDDIRLGLIAGHSINKWQL